MSCVNDCRLCRNFVISEAVAFAGDVLTITLPTTSAYLKGEGWTPPATSPAI